MLRNVYLTHNFPALALVILLAATQAAMAFAYELPQTGIDALRALAETGDADAQFELGFRYNTGAGVEADAATGAEWYRKAAEHGNAKAQYRLGFHLQYLLSDPEQAVDWYQKAAEQGYAKAQLKLGECYSKGLGVEQDTSRANKWFDEAYAQGMPNMFDASRLSCSLPVITPNSLEQSWESRMANAGEPEEQMALAIKYSIIRRGIEALGWTLVAHDAGAQVNIPFLEGLVANMSNAEITEAENFAKAFVPIAGE